MRSFGEAQFFSCSAPYALEVSHGMPAGFLQCRRTLGSSRSMVVGQKRIQIAVKKGALIAPGSTLCPAIATAPFIAKWLENICSIV